MNNSPGIFCFSVDSHDTGTLSVETVHRRRELIQLIEQFDVPSNWTLHDFDSTELPEKSESTAEVPKGLNRGELIQYLRRTSAAMLRDSGFLNSVVLDPHEARLHWDTLVRQGCGITRPRTAGVTSDINPRIVRGGLWVIPMTCQFVGGSRKSVRSLFGICQRHLCHAAANSKLFHLNVEIGNNRGSWEEEKSAIRALFEIATDQQRKGRIRFASFSELPAILTRKPSQPMLSVIRRAA